MGLSETFWKPKQHSGKMKRKGVALGKLALTAVLSAAMVAPSVMPAGYAFADAVAQAQADTSTQYRHGTVAIEAASAQGDVITIKKGETATVAVKPYEHRQYKGCGKGDCPEKCEADHAMDCWTANMGCRCDKTPTDRKANVTTTIADQTVVKASDVAVPDKWNNNDNTSLADTNKMVTKDGTITLTAEKVGTTTLTVKAATDEDGSQNRASNNTSTLLEFWKPATKTYTVKVVDDSVTPEPTEQPSIDGLESKHNYEDSFENTWTYTWPAATLGMGITFDAKTEVEDGSDFIQLYDGSDQLIAEYTGKELAGKTVYVPQSDTFKIKLKSDRSKNAWGFKVTKVEKLESNDLSKVATIDAIAPQFLKDGKAEPAPVVHYGTKVLQAGKDYSVSYQDNTKVGTAKVVVTGMGEYDGTATAEFKVVDNDHLASGTTIAKDQDVQLRQAGDEGAAYIELSDFTKTWGDAVTGVTVTPIDENGKEGEPVKLNKDQYEIDAEYGELAINRTEKDPVFSIKIGEGKPLEVESWGEKITFPQSKQYKVSIEATGYQTTSETMDFYTGASDKFAIVVDEDGKEDTTDDQKVVKTYTKAEIDKMSSFQNGSSQCGMTGSRTFSAVGVPVEKLVEDADQTVTNKDAFKLDTTDNFGRMFTYDQLFGKRYFLKSIYTDQDVKDTYAKLVQSDDEAGATVQLRKLLAQKALEENSIAKPMISSNYAETLISQDEVATAQLPTEENTHINSLVGQENQFRFTYGISLVKEDAKVTFETGDGATTVPEQTVQTNLMTSTDNTTIRSTYWNDALIIYKNGAEAEEPDTNPEKLSVPEDPTREGYTFQGWYTKDGSKDGDWGDKFDFKANNGTVDQDTTLYAKWVVDSEARPDITADQKISLRAASTDDTDVDVSLDRANAVWASKVTGVTVTPLDNDGKPEEANKLDASQYSVEEVKDKSGKVTGRQLVLHRSDEDHIVTANPGDLVDGKGMTVTTRWGGKTTYPNAKQFKIAITADGYEDVTGTITVGTASSDEIQIVVKDGDKETVKATLTQDDLKKMKSYGWQNGSSQCGMTGVRTFSGNGATLKDIFKEAGVDFGEGDKLTINTTDDFPASYTYDQIFDRYFIQGVYDDPTVEDAYKNAATAEGDAATGSTIAFRRAAAESAVKNNTKVEPFISDDYVETMLTGTDWIGNTPVPTEANTSRSKLVNSENKFRFIFGLKVAQQDAKVTFETGDGATTVPEQTVKTHLMTSTENTTMKTKYWVNKIVIEKGAGKKAEELKGTDKIAVPETPTRKGYTFAGWYTKDGSENGDWGQRFNFNDNDGTVDQDTTLYAKWIKEGTESEAAVNPSYSNTNNTGANLGNYEYASTNMGKYPAGKVDFTLNVAGDNAKALALDAETPAKAQDWVAGVTKVTVDGKQLSYKAFNEWKNELKDPEKDAAKLTYYQLTANGDNATLTLPVAQFDTTKAFSTKHVVIESAGYKTAEFDVTYRNIGSNELVVRVLSQDGKTVESTKVLSMDDLKKLPVQKNYFTSSNCDMAGLRSFTSEGVLLTDVLKAAGVSAGAGSQLAFRVNDQLAQNGDATTTDNAYSVTLSYEDLLGTDRYAYPGMWDETKYDELGGKSLHEVLAANMGAWKNDSTEATFIKEKLAESKQKVSPVLAWKWNEGVVAFGGSDPRASKELNEYSSQQSFRLLYGLKLDANGLPVNDYTTPNNTYAVFGIDVIGGKASSDNGNGGDNGNQNNGANNGANNGNQNNGGQNNAGQGNVNQGGNTVTKPVADTKPAGALPQTGDNAMLGVTVAAAAGVACVGAAFVLRKRNRKRA